MTNVQSISFKDVRNPLPKRSKDSHKGMFGHVVVVGGDLGMPGAVRIAAEGALRVGAGVVTVITRDAHIAPVVCGRPELLCYGVEQDFSIDEILARATVILLGPGLGKSNWSLDLFAKTIVLPIPKIIDADGLNILAESSKKYKFNNWILTPHPGEAGRLLGISTQSVQNSRVQTLQLLQEKYGGTIVLKGHETLVGGDEIVKCLDGNPGMATAGMGDLLSGMISGLVSEGVDLFTAAKYGVLLHGHAGDIAIDRLKGVSVLASDVLVEINSVLS